MPRAQHSQKTAPRRSLAGVPSNPRKFPNILSGTSFHNCNGAALLYPDQNGSFYGENASDHYQKVVETGEGKSFSVLKMDASRSSAVYGAANTVQPNSLRALVLVRAY